MADPALTPMPQNLRDAFHFAILAVPPHWNGDDDPDAEFITFGGNPVTPSAICGFVMVYTDPMPGFIHEVLRELGYAGTDYSHVAGARFLMDLINERKANYWSRPS
jgi:hypothetical protein